MPWSLSRIAAVDAEYWGKLGPPVVPAFAGEEAIWDELAGGMGVVDCDAGADVLAAPLPAAGAPLPATLWSFGPSAGFILAWKVP